MNKEFTVTIQNQLGLHVRAATKLVKICAGFKSLILITFKDKEINAKSIISVMSLGAKKDEQLNFKITGDDSNKASLAIQDIFDEKFYEI
jgi:phosphotransferase system HPr (HPr) family protein